MNELNKLVARGVLPPINVYKDKGDYWIVEWVFPGGVSISLNIEKDRKESGWRVTSEQITAYGFLYEDGK